MSYEVKPVGYVRSCFKEKFAIPRQPLLAPAAQGCIELLAPFDQPETVIGLEGISHIWVIFIFHKTLESAPRLKVRPPRLGGIKVLGCLPAVLPTAPTASASRQCAWIA